MNKDTVKRIREAQKYNRMAIKSLFPEKVAGHIDVIENELRDMVMEIVADMVTDELKTQCNAKGEKSSSVSNKKTTKIEIG